MNMPAAPQFPLTLMYAVPAAAALAALAPAAAAAVQAALTDVAAGRRPLAMAPGRREGVLVAAGRRVLCQPHGARLMVLLLAEAPAGDDPAMSMAMPPDAAECERLDAFHAADDGFRVPESVLVRRLEGQSLLRAWRELRGLPLPRLATAADLDAALLQRLERPGQRASARQAHAIGEVLGVPVDALRF
ncbi:hypothetical protein [Plasticicumulans sp.]|uniref:hypothetical protein n=1 Tax=Plasticicumulans sp. TaxID=2307179 RepID=UPI00392A6E0D